MTVLPFPPKPETPADLDAMHADAQAALSEAASHPAMQRDPHRLVIESYATALTYQHEATQQVADMAAAVVQARQPFPQEERDALARGVIATAHTGVQDAVRKEMPRMVRALDRGQVVWLASLIGGAFVLGSVLTWGTLRPRQDAAALDANRPLRPGGPRTPLLWPRWRATTPASRCVLAKVTPHARQVGQRQAVSRRVVSVWLQPAPSDSCHCCGGEMSDDARLAGRVEEALRQIADRAREREHKAARRTTASGATTRRRSTSCRRPTKR